MFKFNREKVQFDSRHGALGTLVTLGTTWMQFLEINKIRGATLRLKRSSETGRCYEEESFKALWNVESDIKVRIRGMKTEVRVAYLKLQREQGRVEESHRMSHNPFLFHFSVFGFRLNGASPHSQSTFSWIMKMSPTFFHFTAFSYTHTHTHTERDSARHLLIHATLETNGLDVGCRVLSPLKTREQTTSYRGFLHPTCSSKVSAEPTGSSSKMSPHSFPARAVWKIQRQRRSFVSAHFNKDQTEKMRTFSVSLLPQTGDTASIFFCCHFCFCGLDKTSWNKTTIKCCHTYSKQIRNRSKHLWTR